MFFATRSTTHSFLCLLQAIPYFLLFCCKIYITKFTILKCTIQTLRTFTMLYSHSTIQFQNIFITCKENPMPIKLSFPLHPPPTTGNHQSPYCPYGFEIFWIFHRNGIMQCVAFSDWLLSLRITFSRFICTVAFISASVHLWLNNIPLDEYTIICLFIHLLMDLWVASTFQLF